MAEPVLDEMKTDALGEVYNIAMGSAATAVAGMIDETVSITAPEVTVCQASKIVKTKLNKIVKGILFTKGEENICQSKIYKRNKGNICHGLQSGGHGDGRKQAHGK